MDTQMKTVYIPTPTIQEMPTETGWYNFSFNYNGNFQQLYYSSQRKKLFRFIENEEIEVPTALWLKPLEVKDVPTDQQIVDHFESISSIELTPKERIMLSGAAIWMRNELTPLIASQQNRIAELEKRSEKLNEVSAMTKIQELELQIAALVEPTNTEALDNAYREEKEG